MAAQNVPDIDLTCSGAATLEGVLQKLVANSSHRLWVQDAAGVPVGIVSITDICKILNKK